MEMEIQDSQDEIRGQCLKEQRAGFGLAPAHEQEPKEENIFGWLSVIRQCLVVDVSVRQGSFQLFCSHCYKLPFLKIGLGKNTLLFLFVLRVHCNVEGMFKHHHTSSISLG